MAERDRLQADIESLQGQVKNLQASYDLLSSQSPKKIADEAARNKELLTQPENKMAVTKIKPAVRQRISFFINYIPSFKNNISTRMTESMSSTTPPWFRFLLRAMSIRNPPD